MIGGSSCSVHVLHREGTAFRLKRVMKRETPNFGDHAGRCGDCGAPERGYHHLGCDMQACPCCRRQMLSCGCWFDEDAEDIVDDETIPISWTEHRWLEYLEAS
jgi:hypothetical protein